jgi:hypothetical protein
MEESIEEATRREETLRIYNSTKEALRIIGDVARDTLSDQISSSTTTSNYRQYDSLPAPAVYNK